jgi:hypothetical protein
MNEAKWLKWRANWLNAIVTFNIDQGFPARPWLSGSNTTPFGVARASQKAMDTIAPISRSINQTSLTPIQSIARPETSL